MSQEMHKFESRLCHICRRQEVAIQAYYENSNGFTISVGEWENEEKKDIFMVQFDIFLEEKNMYSIEEEDKTGTDCMKSIPKHIDEFLKENCYGKTMDFNQLVEIIEKVFEFVKKERGYEYVRKQL